MTGLLAVRIILPSNFIATRKIYILEEEDDGYSHQTRLARHANPATTRIYA
jgi:hypothetical protein